MDNNALDQVTSAALDTQRYPEGVVMFAPDALARTEGLPVDTTLANLLGVYHTKPATDIHGLFHRTASVSEIEPRFYEHSANNPTSIANWMPPLIEAHAAHAAQTGAASPLRIPRTQVMRLDPALAQFTRVQYDETNEISRRAFNTYLTDALDLPDDAFIKTGTFSGKFQFANCHCTEPEEMGEYFQVITNFAMTVGAGESIDIAVRDYIHDHNTDRPTIYGGMPLRCEYRFFVDFGRVDDATADALAEHETAPMTRTAMQHAFDGGAPVGDIHPIAQPRILGVTHYWHPRVMKAHFARTRNDPDFAQYAASNTYNQMVCDADNFAAFEPHLISDFDHNLDAVTESIDALLPHMQAAGFRGAWSIDVMCNLDADGTTSYHLIDMALACESALIDELYTVDELRHVDLHEIIAATSGEIMAYPQAPEFVAGTYTDGHGVCHTLTHGSAEAALRAGVEHGVIPTDGSAVPTVVRHNADGAQQIVSAPALPSDTNTALEQ